jgi:hypothetical protein
MTVISKQSRQVEGVTTAHDKIVSNSGEVFGHRLSLVVQCSTITPAELMDDQCDATRTGEERAECENERLPIHTA